MKNQSTTIESWVGIEEAAVFLGVKPSWIYQNWQKRGIPARKIDGLAFKISDLDAWAKTQEPKPSKRKPSKKEIKKMVDLVVNRVVRR